MQTFKCFFGQLYVVLGKANTAIFACTRDSTEFAFGHDNINLFALSQIYFS